MAAGERKGFTVRMKLLVTVALAGLAMFAVLAVLTESFILTNNTTLVRDDATSALEAARLACLRSRGAEAAVLAERLREVAADYHLAFVAVADDVGQVVGQAGSSVPSTLAPDSRDLRDARDDIFRASMDLGPGYGRLSRVQVGVSVAGLRQRVADGRRRAFLGGALVFIVSLIGTSIAVGHLTRPVAALRTGAEAVGRGEFDARVEVKSGDELEELAGAFNAMAAQLSEARGTLEEGLASRTAQLAEAYDELLAANRALEQSEHRYRSVVERANDVIYVIGLDGTIISANRQTHRILGRDWRAGDLEGRNHLEFIVPEDHRIAATAIETVLEDGAVSSVDLRFRCGDGQTRRLRLNAVALSDGKKRAGAQIIARDVTERSRHDADLAVADKLRALGELAAAIAHEINSPMCAVITFLETARQQAEAIGAPASLLADLRTVRAQSERVVRIAERVLTFARPEPPRMDAIDVNEVIVSGLEIAKYGRAAAKVDIVYDLDESLPPVSASRDQLQEVLLNLAINAQEAMQSGGTLTVSTRRENSFVRVDLTDTGPGISKENIERVFEPGFSTKSDDGVAKGLGLGLFLSQRIIASLDGTMSVTSEEGRGATFTIRLPALGPSLRRMPGPDVRALRALAVGRTRPQRAAGPARDGG